MQGFEKSDVAVLDYSFDWSEWLDDGEIIVDSQWEVPEALSIEAKTYTDTISAIWLSGGEYGGIYVVTNTITTDSSPARVDARSIKLRITVR